MVVGDLFFKNSKGESIEGYLGKPDECRILYVLREPNDSNPTGFWFRDNVVSPNNGKQREGLKYFYSLGKLAYRLLGGEKNSPEDYEIEQALKKCAYININYVNGGPSKSLTYRRTLNYLHFINRKQDKKKWRLYSNCEARAIDCLNIIINMDCDYIVTTWDIFNALVGEKTDDNADHYKGIEFINSIVFRIAYYNGKIILSFDPYSGRDYCKADFSKVYAYIKENKK